MNVQTSISTVNKMEDSISSNIPFYKKHYHLAMNIRWIWKKHWIDKLQPSLNIIKLKKTKKGMDSRIKSECKCKGWRVKRTQEASNNSTASSTNMINNIINMLHSMQTNSNHRHIRPQARKVHNHLLIVHLHSWIYIKSEIVDDYMFYLVLVNMLIYLTLTIGITNKLHLACVLPYV